MAWYNIKHLFSDYFSSSCGHWCVFSCSLLGHSSIFQTNDEGRWYRETPPIYFSYLFKFWMTSELWIWCINVTNLCYFSPSPSLYLCGPSMLCFSSWSHLTVSWTSSNIYCRTFWLVLLVAPHPHAQAGWTGSMVAPHPHHPRVALRLKHGLSAIISEQYPFNNFITDSVSSHSHTAGRIIFLGENLATWKHCKSKQS